MDPYIGMCRNLDLNAFSFMRSLLFFSYDGPLMFVALASIFYTLFMIEFVNVKKSKVPGGLSYTLWYSFVVSLSVLLIIVFYFFINSNPTTSQNFSGVYSYLSFSPKR